LKILKGGMNPFLPKFFFPIVVALGVLFCGETVLAGNIPSWGGATTTTQPQPIQQPRHPIVSQPAPITAQTVQTTQPRSWKAPATTSSLTVSTPVQQLQTRPVETVVTGRKWADWSDLAWEATKKAVNNMWKLQAVIQNVTITGSTVVGAPGCLKGPDLGPFIRSHLLTNEMPAEVADVFANSVAGAWNAWQDSVTIPGLPWYPAFAAWPGPQAPPTPNIPTPLISLSTRQMDLSSSERLAARIFEQFRGTEISPDARDAINSFSRQFSSSFTIWLSGTQVQNVMGQGTVPTFAPPVIVVGPVVSGNVIPTPGIIIGNMR
jgi:hypothetical protein